MAKLIITHGSEYTYWTLPPSVAKDLFDILKHRLGEGKTLHNAYVQSDEENIDYVTDE